MKLKLETLNKINIKLFNSLKENLKYPFLVLNHKGDILFSNNEASLLLSINQKEDNIFNLFEEVSSTKLKNLVEEVYISNKSISNEISIQLSKGNSFNAQVTASAYKEDEEFFVFCTIKPLELKIGALGQTLISSKINNDNIIDLITNQKINELLNEIKSLYPFTFVGKERLSNDLNKLDELFWIKTVEGKFAIANKSLANLIGLGQAQIEGKSVRNFLPLFLNTLLDTIENYIKETLNSVSIKGIPVFGISEPSDKETVIIPLVDSDNNVIAFVGIVQQTKQRILLQEKSKVNFVDPNIFKGIAKPISLIDKEGIFKHESKEFCKLFSKELKDFINLKVDQVFSRQVSAMIRDFMASTFDNEKIELTGDLDLSDGKAKKYDLQLSKIFDQENQLIGAVILIESGKLEDSLETIIKNRGRMFDILIQNNPEPIFIYETENLRFLEVNQAALTLYGYRRDEFLQMDLTDLYTPEDIQTLLGSSDAAAVSGKFTGPFRHKKKDGSSVIVEISKLAFKFDNKETYYNIIKDVTSQLDLEKKNLLYKSAFDNTEDMVFLTDANGFITFINLSAENYLGYSKIDLENTSFASLAKDDSRGLVNSSIFQSGKKEPVKMQLVIKKSNGNFLNIELFATPILDYKGEIDSFTILAKIEKDSNIHQKEQMSESAADDIWETNTSDEQLMPDTISTSFLSNLFHEILTPINVILGFVQELKESIQDLTPEQKESVEFINQNKERLLSTMNSMVEFASIDKDNEKIIPQLISITEVIDQLQEDLKDVLKTKGLELAYGKISSSLKFESDKQKFQTFISIAMKIVSQIIKEKKLYFSSFPLDDDYFAITFRDSYATTSKGLAEALTSIFQSNNYAVAKDYGIPKITVKLVHSLLKLLFGKFRILENSQDKNNYGFVFPISLAKSLETSNSDLLQKEVLKDSQVFKEENIIEPKLIETIETPEIPETPSIENIERVIPLSELNVVKEDRPNILSNRIDLTMLSCLYIEDQVDSQILFKVQMKELKSINFAVSFEEALPLLDEHHFDFVVMDINLQGEYNGLDALKIIHKMPNYENIPIIAVTAYVLPGDKEKFIATGFNDFISKPIFREKMIESLEKIFLMHV